MNPSETRQSKRIKGLEASPVSELKGRGKKSETGARPKESTKESVEKESSTAQDIGHSVQSSGAESSNPIGSSSTKSTLRCGFRKLVLQKKVRDSGFAEESIVEKDESCEEVTVERRTSIYPPEQDRFESFEEEIEEYPTVSSSESPVTESGDEVSRQPSPEAMAQRKLIPKLKYREPPIFYGKKNEDATDCAQPVGGRREARKLRNVPRRNC
ncbi:hypothetical protein GHT06_018512 [Daphnia sinensis]|uniref:Uncharacterized protein n=1 Tax=Daphnia sinensis TaxID=1820382 RepID=A0AAD5PT71_9CRUS|nr:hypothetical protein GHT06_018512 [Daphnia sinensis]